MSFRIIPASIAIRFSSVNDENRDYFKNDFEQCVQTHIDPIREWISIQEAKGHVDESEKNLMLLMAELFKKMDKIEQLIQGNDPYASISFENNIQIFGIGFEHIRFNEELLSVGQSYYGKIFLPVFPQHPISVYFEAIDTHTAHITHIHENDRISWDRYTMGRERSLLAEMRGV